ncbi:MAG: Mpo1-like protein, partial [Myxococcaceae bacterium]
MRTANAWFTSYSGDHQNSTNRTIHWVCVPAILWAVIAALWTVPVPAELGAPWLWAG